MSDQLQNTHENFGHSEGSEVDKLLSATKRV